MGLSSVSARLLTGEYAVVFELYFPSASIDHLSVDTYKPAVVQGQFLGFQLINLQFTPDHWFI